MFTVHGEGTGLVCALCGAKFYNKSHLKTHMSSKHETAKLYQCDQCEKSYRYPAGLKIHKLTHTGELGWCMGWRRVGGYQCEKSYRYPAGLKT